MLYVITLRLSRYFAHCIVTWLMRRFTSKVIQNLKGVYNNYVTEQNGIILENVRVAELSNISPHLMDVEVI